MSRIVTIDLDNVAVLRDIMNAYWACETSMSLSYLHDALATLLPPEPTPEPKHFMSVIEDANGEKWRPAHENSTAHTGRFQWSSTAGAHRYWSEHPQPVTVLFPTEDQ